MGDEKMMFPPCMVNTEEEQIRVVQADSEFSLRYLSLNYLQNLQTKSIGLN